MDNQRLLDCLDADYRRLRDVAGSADLAAQVPSCPDWTMAGLLRHVGTVYLHKVECMRLGREPEPWPPASLDAEPPLELLDRSYAALTAEFAARRPADHAFTWYPPDQTVGFWIRRMAQETVIHRVDGELGAGVPVAPIPGDLAADGVDEVLVRFLEFGTTNWPEEFAGLLPPAGERTVGLVTPQRSWLVRIASTAATAAGMTESAAGAADAADATVEGPAEDVLLWLWARDGKGVTTTGDREVISLLRKLLVINTQ